MRQKSMSSRAGAEQTVRDIRRRTRKQYSAEEKIRIVLSGLRGEDSIGELCRREGIAESLYNRRTYISCALSQAAFKSPAALSRRETDSQ